MKVSGFYCGGRPLILERLQSTISGRFRCGSGLRSQIAASLLQKHGYPRVRNLTGGFEAWEDAGLPVEKP